jgi:pimeloyl-ACP methyl ester carboxylesterase
MRPVLVGCFCLLGLGTGPVAADDRRPISPAEAVQRVNAAVTVEMAVRATKNRLVKRGEIYLDSEPDFHDPKNLGVVITREGTARFRQVGIADPAIHFQGKTIRVKGTVLLKDKRPRIEVNAPEQIELLRTSASNEHAQGLPVTTGMAEVAEPVLYYETTGEGEPVVLIHGGQLDCRMWDEQFQTFAQHYRVIRYDVRGYGKSELPTKPYADEKDLLGLLQYLHIEKAHLIGLSLGGRIAIDFTLTYPDRVKSLVAVGPGLSGFAWSAEGEKRSWQIVKAARDQGAHKAAELWLQDPYMAPAMENPALAKRLRQLAQHNARCWLVNPILGRELNPPAANRLAEIQVPTLVIIGERDVPDIQAIGKLLEKGVPHAQKVMIPGAGHMVNLEKPQEFNLVVRSFLEGIAR